MIEIDGNLPGPGCPPNLQKTQSNGTNTNTIGTSTGTAGTAGAANGNLTNLNTVNTNGNSSNTGGSGLGNHVFVRIRPILSSNPSDSHFHEGQHEGSRPLSGTGMLGNTSPEMMFPLDDSGFLCNRDDKIVCWSKEENANGKGGNGNDDVNEDENTANGNDTGSSTALVSSTTIPKKTQLYLDRGVTLEKHKFHRVFSGIEEDNKSVFDELNSTDEQNLNGKITDSVFAGINETVFSYGQTGSGKTHTICGNQDELGLLHFFIQSLFNLRRRIGEGEMKIQNSDSDKGTDISNADRSTGGNDASQGDKINHADISSATIGVRCFEVFGEHLEDLLERSDTTRLETIFLKTQR
jgi:hypothetical protein